MVYRACNASSDKFQWVVHQTYNLVGPVSTVCQTDKAIGSVAKERLSGVQCIYTILDSQSVVYVVFSCRQSNRGGEVTAHYQTLPYDRQDFDVIIGQRVGLDRNLPYAVLIRRSRSGKLRTQKFKSHLVRPKSLNVLPLKPGVGQYIAIHASLTARDFFLAYFYPSSPFTCIFYKTSPDFFLCWLSAPNVILCG